jgi:Zn-finger nucleic acid-binding protein
MANRTDGMACPIDGTALVMSDRQNIEIDYCPTCRGVWLDRGELDKIIERSVAAEAPTQAAPPPQRAAPPQRPWGGDDHGYGHSHGHKKRRKSFLEDLFD